MPALSLRVSIFILRNGKTTPWVPHQYEAVCGCTYDCKARRKGFEFEVKEHLLSHALGLKVRNLSLYPS